MTIHLADPGDPRQLIGYRRSGQPIYLARGGDGTDDTDSGGDDSDATDDDEEDSKDDTNDKDEDEKDTKDDSELQKAIRRRDRALREKRAIQRELEELRNKDKKDDPDPIAVANARLVRSEVRAQLAAVGVTERDDQKAVLEVLNLDGVSVGDDGDVDIDEIEDRIGELRRIFGGNGKVVKRTPRVDTRDRGKDKDKETDPDADRYKRILGRR